MTEVTLREHMEAQLAAHHELHVQHDAAHAREHQATEQAIAKAEISTSTALKRADEVVTTRFEAQNEWRQAMTDRERTFLSKAEYQPAHDGLRARIDALEDAGIARTSREQERERSTTRTMALVGLGATLISVALSLLIRLGIG